MAAIRDEKELVRDVRRFMRFVRPDLDTSEVSLINHLVFFPASIAGSMIFDRADEVQALQLLASLTGTALEDEASNFGFGRRTGTRARVDVIFFTVTQPTGEIVIPAGTIVSTVSFNLGRAILYRTLATRRIPAGGASQAFFVTDRQRWESDPVPAEAVETGIDSTVGDNRITVVQGSVPGIDGVFNPAASTPGKDIETDDVLRDRVQRKRMGAERNLRKGAESFLLNTRPYQDAKAIRTDEDQSERANGVDVFVIDDSLTETSQTFTHQSTIDVYALAARPVLEVIGVSGAGGDGGLGSTLTENEDFYFERDVTFTQRLSAKSSDRIRLTGSGHRKIAENELFIVQYTFVPEIANGQADLDAEDTQILSANLLIKKAIRFDVDIRAAITFFAGIGDPDEQKERIQLALIDFFQSFRLGAPIQESDIIGVIQSGLSGLAIQSIDQVIIREITATSEFGEVRKLSDDPTGEQITFDSKEYCRLATVSFTTIT